MSILQRAHTLYKKKGLRFLIYTILLNISWEYLEFLNTRDIPVSEKYVSKEINGSKMCLDVTDKGISRDLIVDGIREAYFLETVKKEIKERDIVIDIGANIGYYALLEARIVGDKGRVYAIEPVPANIAVLKKNIELNQYTNIELHQLAIGDKNGYATIYVPKERNLSSMIQPGNYSKRMAPEEINVEVITLDEFLKDKPYPNIIRMDVEGYEYQIINGMKKTLRRKSPLTLLMELHFNILKRDEAIEILKILGNAGFEIIDATSESGIRGFSHHAFWWRLTSYIESARRNAPPVGHHNLNISEVISNTSIIDGNWGALEICFKKMPPITTK